MSLDKLSSIQGAVFYATRLEQGTIVMSTNREGGSNEQDEKTRLIVITKDQKIHVKEFGQWRWKGKFAKLRFQRGQGAPYLAMTVLNQENYNNQLIIFPESSLIRFAKNKDS